MEKQNSTKNGITIVRIFDAPPESVWHAWTDSELMIKWWGPKDSTTPVCKMDFRVGGKLTYCMRSPDGKDYWGTGTIKEIIPMKKIVYTDSFTDENGNVVSASHYGMEESPLESLVTVTFEEADHGKTQMTLRHVGIPEGAMSDDTQAGWNEMFDKLANLLH